LFVKRIDRIDTRGDIREHLTSDNRTTICGLSIDLSQDAAGNGLCKRCARIFAARCQNAPAPTS